MKEKLSEIEHQGTDA